jgi:predicted RND superfamily exporter protein
MKQRWLNSAVRHPWLTILIVFTLMLVCAFGAKNLSFRGDFRLFFSPDNPQMQAFERMHANFNKSDNIMVVIVPRAGTVFDETTLRVVKQLTDAAWQTPFSLRVDSITNFQHTQAVDDDLLVEDLLLDIATLSLDKVQQIQQAALAEPALAGRLVAKDGSLTVINITLQVPEQDQNTQVSVIYSFVENMIKQAAAEHPELEFHLAGVIALNQAFSSEAQHDASTLVPLMFVVIIVILALMLRSALAAGAVVVIIILTIASTMGLAGWAGIYLNTATVNVPTILMTLAVADSVHLIASTQFFMRQGLTKSDAIQQAMRLNMMPVFITSATTAVGFATLNYSEVPILRDLGNMTAVGVMLAWFITIVLLPALLQLLPISQGAAEKGIGGMDKIADWVIAKNQPILWGTLLLSIFAVWFAMQNKVNDEAVKYFSPSTDYRQALDVLEAKLGGVSQIDFTLESGQASGVHDPAFIAATEQFGLYLESLPYTKHVSKISDVFKRLNKNMHGDDPAFYRLPESAELAAQYLLMYEMSLPFGLDLNNQLDLDKSSTKVSAALINLGSKEMTELEVQAITWFNAQYPQYKIEASSTALMFAHIGERNMASMMQSLPMAMLLISALLMISLRSLRLGLISLLPNLVPALMGFGLWYFYSGEINLGLSIVASMSLGIIVDDTVHFLAKYQAARKEGRDAEAAVRYAFHSVGWALVITTVVLVIGFSVLLLSDFRLNSDMGMLTGIIILLALIIDFLFLPAVLLRFDRKETAIKPNAGAN